MRESNNLRAARGVSKLTLDDTLNRVAMIRAMEMAYSDYYHHQRPNGSCQGGTIFTSIYKAIASHPKTSYTASENITYGNTWGAAMESWIGSPDHLGAIVSSDYKNIGIGYFSYANKTYWVQIFMS